MKKSCGSSRSRCVRSQWLRRVSRDKCPRGAFTAKRRRLLRLGQEARHALPDDVLKARAARACATAPAGRADGRSSEASWTSRRELVRERTPQPHRGREPRERYPSRRPNRSGRRRNCFGDSLEDAFRDLSRATCALSRHVLRRCDAVSSERSGSARRSLRGRPLSE